MIDRFKFRAWLKDREKYDYDIEDCFEDWVFENFGQYLKDKDVIVEQCTGLKDKNGELIYEGDIVRVLEQYKTNTTEQLYPMMFNEKVAKFGFKHPDGHFFYFTNDDNFSYEVIGNIHENADLLGEE